MSEFWTALWDPSLPFLRYALFAGLLASVPLGVTGSYVVARRISYLAGAIAHCTLGGIGAALYIQYRFGLQSVTWLPMLGALIQALASALIVGLVSLRGREREDTIIGAVWALGMAQGLLFLARTPMAMDPMSYLFGNILFVSRADLALMGGLAAVTVTLAWLFHSKLVAVCFDEEFARLRGIRVEAYFLLLLCLTAFTVVMLIRVVGIVMVIALLTLPAAAAGHLSKRMLGMMAWAVVVCAVANTVGLALSYRYELPSGAVIIGVAGALYLAVAGIARVTKK